MLDVRQPLATDTEMGTWGTALYSDDLAADLRDEFRELIGEGLSASEVVDRLKSEYAESLDDCHQATVFWLALADIGWRLGRLDDQVRREAIRAIDSGDDLARWETPSDRKKREKVLFKLSAQLRLPPPAPKRVARLAKAANDWETGELIGFQLVSGRWVLLRVVGHHEDRGGRDAVCELLDWVGETIPTQLAVEQYTVLSARSPHSPSQFLFQEPTAKRDRARVVRTGVYSAPSQKIGGYSGFVWPHTDRLFRDIFGLE